MLLCFLDLETGGLDPCAHDILEIGALIFNTETKDVEKLFSLKVKPVRDIDSEAAKVNGYSEEEWIKDSVSLKQAMETLTNFVKGSVMVAQNVVFDASFLQQAEKRTGVTLPFSRHKVDLVTLAWLKVPPYTLRSYSLKNLCAYLNVPPEPDVHRALNGAMAAYECYKKLI